MLDFFFAHVFFDIWRGLTKALSFLGAGVLVCSGVPARAGVKMIAGVQARAGVQMLAGVQVRARARAWFHQPEIKENSLNVHSAHKKLNDDEEC